MSSLLIGLLGALVATNQPAAVSNLVTQTTGLTISVPDSNDPVEQAYHQLTVDDQAALDEVDAWIKENKAFADKGGGVPADILNSRIHTRLAPVKKAYEDFLKLHPEHIRARLAYASFLLDTGEEDASKAEYEKVIQSDPKNPVPYNQLANEYSEHGPIAKAFEYYAKAVELDPTQSLYYRNFGTTVYLFRKDAQEIYKINEQQVFDKALALYAQAMKLDPQNFELAQDIAETYYGIRPLRLEDALNAWTNTLQLAHNDLERQGVYIHLARFKISAGRFDEGRAELEKVHDPALEDLKKRGFSNLEYRIKEAQAKATNSAPAQLEVH